MTRTRFRGLLLILSVMVAAQAILPACEKRETVEEDYLSVYPTRLHFSNDSSGGTLLVRSNVPWTASLPLLDSAWITLDIAAGRGDTLIHLTVQENLAEENRDAIVQLSSGTITRQVRVTQGQMTVYPDGYLLPLNPSPFGDSVCLVFIGEGFTEEDLAVDGRYEQTMRQAADHFFSIEPYRSYASYFSSYALIVESPRQGIGWGSDTVGNRFATYFLEGATAGVKCNHDEVRAFVRRHLPRTDTATTCVVMVLNSPEYGGTTYVYPDGYAIAMCSMSQQAAPNDFQGLIHHEAGGHGFGLLGDEYIIYPDQTLPPAQRDAILSAQSDGLWLNLDVALDTLLLPWAELVADSAHHPGIGIHEGGYAYGKGIWRSEHNSCMNDNIPYYNTWSRWLIVRRLMTAHGRPDFPLAAFLALDRVTPPADTVALPASRAAHATRPLPPPILLP